jgi:hypothetical protein
MRRDQRVLNEIGDVPRHDPHAGCDPSEIRVQDDAERVAGITISGLRRPGDIVEMPPVAPDRVARPGIAAEHRAHQQTER